MTIDKPIVLKAAELPDWTTEELRARFTVLELPKDAADAAAFLRENGAGIRGCVGRTATL